MKPQNNNVNEAKNGESTLVINKSKIPRRIQNEVADIYNDKGIREILGKVVKSGLKKMPGVGTVLTLLDEGYQAVMDMEQKQRHARVEDFVTGIAKTLPDQADISAEDFLAVLRKVLQDDEKSKIWFYVRLLVKLGTGTLDRDTRFHLIHLTYNLTFKQIMFSRELYLRKTLELRGYNTREDAELELTSTKNGMTQRAIFTFTNWGLIREDRTGDIRRDPLYILNDEMNTLINLLFDERDLHANVIDKELKDRPDVVILTSIKSDGNLYETELPQALEKQGLKVVILPNNSEHEKETLGGIYVELSTESRQQHYRDEIFTCVGVRITPDKNGDKLVNVRINQAIFNGSNKLKTSLDPLRAQLNKVRDEVLRLHQERTGK